VLLRIIYVTSTLPYGSREAFIIPEIAEFSRAGHDVRIIPMRPRGEIVHDDTRSFLGATLALPLISGEIICGAFAEALSFPSRTFRTFSYLLKSRTLKIFLKNVGVFPKGLWLSRQARRIGADHLHAHWASTSATMALVAGEISGIPWSFTAHRWDIAENNLLRVKAMKACFVRSISERGAQAIASYAASASSKVRILHLGVEISDPTHPNPRRNGTTQLRAVAAADFVEVKGHRYLLEALKILRGRGRFVQVDLVGDGPLRADLERQVEEADLAECVTFLGTVSHLRLLEGLRAQRWDLLVLPSVGTENAEEGIPVSLIEAMGAGVPVLSTRTGAIPELLQDGEGLLVAGGDSVALAGAMEVLARNPALREQLAEKGRRRVLKEFNILVVAPALARCFEECAAS
jgi:colanic acid/amylovoran biosynthesis glycosyltransferase